MQFQLLLFYQKISFIISSKIKYLFYQFIDFRGTFSDIFTFTHSLIAILPTGESVMQEIIGLERTLYNGQEGLAWNNKKIRWSIVHNYSNQTKPYDIELEMVLVSSKRIIKVNGTVKDCQMCSFGYQAQFDISDMLKGYIKQQSLTFQLYVNGDSFTKLQTNKNAYQPPIIGESTNGFFQPNINSKKTNSQVFQIQSKKNQSLTNSKVKNSDFFKEFQTCRKIVQKAKESSKTKQLRQSEILDKKVQPIIKQQPIVIQPATMGLEQKQNTKSTQNTLKDAQSQLMKILMQQKRKRNEEKALQLQKGLNY